MYYFNDLQEECVCGGGGGGGGVRGPYILK